jgi:uncharacterized protein YggE
MKGFLASLVLLAGAGVASANVTVTGTGKVTYTPDIGHVRLGVSTDGATATEAWQKNAAAVKKVFDALKGLGIAAKDMQTSGLSVTPRYVHPKNEPARLVGYTASYTLTITVRDLTKLGSVLDAAVAAGANRDVSLSFGCSDPEKLLDQARARAVAEARKKALIYVQGAGASLGQVVSINEGTSMPWRQFTLEHRPMAAGGDALPIATGEQELSVTVTVSYGIAHLNGPR